MNPIIKFAGGKRTLAPRIIELLGEGGRYYEPFAGGAAVFFALEAEGAVLADSNGSLATMYRTVAKQLPTVLRLLREHADRHSPDYYRTARDRFNDRRSARIVRRRPCGAWTDPAQAALFLYLNKTCFNGLWRVNRRGDFNVPAGRHKALCICDEPALRAASKLLRTAELRQGDFAATAWDAKPGDRVYCDPPYVPLSDTANFRSYTTDGFSADDQRRLAAWARELRARGVRVVLTNHDTPWVRELYAGFRFESVTMRRSINAAAEKRGGVAEVIIHGGGQ